jgi:hypothetical protein
LTEAVAIYNKKHPKNQISLTQKQVNNFAKTNMMGVPFRDLAKVLDMDAAKLDSYMTELGEEGVGIPINGNKDKQGALNDFQIWMSALSNVAQTNRNDKLAEMGLDDSNPDDKAKIRELNILYNALFQGRGVSIKADKDTPFAKINEVFDNLQTMGLNKFTLQTALKTEEN